MIDEKKFIEWLLGKKYISVDENSADMTAEFEKQHLWELSRNCLINDIVRHIDKMPKVSLKNKTSDKWISCSQELPKEAGWYWVVLPEEECRKCWFSTSIQNWLFFNDVLAWQPIESYEE